jgi:hypothetical protein
MDKRQRDELETEQGEVDDGSRDQDQLTRDAGPHFTLMKRRAEE